MKFFETLKNAYKIEELRDRIALTLLDIGYLFAQNRGKFLSFLKRCCHRVSSPNPGLGPIPKECEMHRRETRQKIWDVVSLCGEGHVHVLA